jgi:CHAP domain
MRARRSPRSSCEAIRSLALRCLVCVAASPLLGCSSGAIDDSERIANQSQPLTTYGNWADYGDGQCVTGARAFYEAKFGITLSATGVQTTDVGACKYLGACMYWVSPKVEPSAKDWNRYDWGTEMPKLYDLVIYPPHGSNAYGHVASVDHMDGSDPTAYSKLYVMDSNATVANMKSPTIHTNGWQPYGFYRLKSLEGPWCSPGMGTALNCGDQTGIHDGDKDTLYSCSGLTATATKKCATKCVHTAVGKDDTCEVVASDAGVDAATTDATSTEPATDGDAGIDEVGADAGTPTTNGDMRGAGCAMSDRGSVTADGAIALASLLGLALTRRRRDSSSRNT